MAADSWWGYYEDPLSPWIEERENPLLDGVQNAEWLPVVDTDDEIVEVDDDNNESNDSGNGGGLSPPSGNGGDGGGSEEANEGDGGGGDDEDAQVDHDPYGETPPIYRRYRNLTDMDRSDGSLLNSGGDVSHSRRGKRKQNVHNEDSSSSSIAQSFSDFEIDPYYQQSNGGYFGYVFGQGATLDDSQSESTSNAPPRHSTMCSVIEAIVNDCQLVILPFKGDQFFNSKLIANDLKAGIEVNRKEEDGYFYKEDILKAVKIMMVDYEKEPGKSIRENHMKWS
ncbi:anthocyanidin 3-O-glucoside 2'''-O-xylosyltransferase [Trifolium repens]|nr:anthocyanidin 3-O-glucoside 2'''-O-xylosyltransferase [Trifolium repens]